MARIFPGTIIVGTSDMGHGVMDMNPNDGKMSSNKSKITGETRYGCGFMGKESKTLFSMKMGTAQD